MGGFYNGNPEDTVVGSTDATEDTINENAVTETDSTSSFYRGSPEQTTVDGYVADAAGHATAASNSASEASNSASEASDSESAAASSASAAASLLAQQQNLEITSASFDTTDGALTLTKANSGTVTTDLDGRYADLTGATFTGDISFRDDVKAKFGDDDDLLIYHSTTSGQKSVIEDTGTGGLDLITNGSSISLITDDNETMINASKDSGVLLNHNNYIKLQTTVDGIRVWDDAQFDTNINVDGNITVSGTVDGVDIATLNSNAIVDGDFTSEGLIKRDATLGSYSIVTDNSSNWDTAYGWGDHSTEGYITSFDITTQTDPKYLRSDAADTATGFINFTGGIGVTGDMGVSGGLSATNLDVSTSGSVTTNISTGTNSSSSHVKNVNIGTGYNNGGTTNITIGATSTTTTTNIDLNGDVELNGVPLQHVKRYSSDLHGFNFKYLSTLVSQVGANYYSRGTATLTKRFINIDALANYGSSTTTNAKNMYVRCCLTSASANTVNIGNVFSITSPAAYKHTIEISGDVSHYFSEYSGCSANANGANAFSTARAVYNPFIGRTIIQAGTYGSTVPSAGDALYVHPFDWESTGTELIGLTNQHTLTPSSTVVARNVNLHFYLGAYSPTTIVKIKAYEGSGDNVYVTRLRLYETQEDT